MKDISIQASEIGGLGLFAQKGFSKGDVVYAYEPGRIVRKDDIESLSSDEKQHLDYLGDDQYEIIEPPASYVNHSCDPNIEEKNRVARALRRIEEGEEITIDYNKIAYIENPIPCECGAKRCKGIIKGKRV